MKDVLIILISMSILFCFCGKKEQQKKQLTANPFLSEYDTPFNTPPFNKITEAHYMPAFKEGMKQQKEEIEAIINNSQPPTFKNTVEALELSGAVLSKVSNVFYNLNSALTNDKIQSIAKEVSPLLSKHRDDIFLNEKLFQKIKSVYENKETFDLNNEQKRLLEEYYKDFVRNGANLDDKKKERLREINKKLSLLSLQFGENILKEVNRYKMVIDKKEDLAGLPESVISAAAETAAQKGEKGKWVFTLQKTSWIPFLQYSQKRNLREKIYRAWMNMGNNNDELDNKQILSEMAALRVERANLLGYKNHAHFVLEEYMAKKPENVYDLLTKIWKPALKKAKEEREQMQKIINSEGKDFKLKPWDWWYYAEKIKKQNYDLDENEIRPYFKLENVREGAFNTASRLFGITFTERTDIPVYHKDVKVFEVKDEEGKHLGILYVDYFPRDSKRGGAWMNNYREQEKINGKNIRPIVVNCGNFTKPVGDKPSLLNIDQTKTLFHEFGHGLHSLLSQCTYKKLSGTSVPRDFVEVPSQIMEHWAMEPSVLKTYAKHYETGEPIPDELIEKIKRSGHFNQGFATVEYLAASFLDMDWHTLTKPEQKDVLKFEKKSMDRIGLIPEIIPRYRSTYFQHIFSGGYSSGYYSYIWSEVLDSDAFEAFKENGLFDKETALSLKKNIYEKGGTEDPMVLFKRFRGREPEIEPLLKNRGLIQ